MTVFGMILTTCLSAAVPTWFLHKKQYSLALFTTLLFLAGIAA
jgi:hypothetical protein